MVSVLQKCLSLFVFSASTVGFVLFAKYGNIFVATAVGTSIFFSYAAVLGAEFIALHQVQSRSPVRCRASVRSLVIAWAIEVVTTPRIFFWRQPFRSNACRDYLPPDAHGRRGVLLVHGLVCNRGFWNPWMRRFRQRDTPFVAVNLEPLFGSIDAYAAAIEHAVAQMERATKLPVVIVGHSMGGLAVRAWLNSRKAERRVHRVITIGAPHRGTWLARFSSATNGKQMRIGSEWLAQLSPGDSPERCALYTCYYGNCDNIVFPADRATLPGAFNVHLAGVAHVRMAFEPVVFDDVCRWVDQPLRSY